VTVYLATEALATSFGLTRLCRLAGTEHAAPGTRNPGMRGKACGYSSLIFACIATAFHFASSAWMNALNASGVPPAIWAPCARSLSAISGVVSALFTSALIFRMMCFGVAAGAINPPHETASNPAKPSASSTVGTSAIDGRRVRLVTASALSFADCTCGVAASAVGNAAAICLLITSMIAGASPLYGICSMGAPKAEKSSSPAR